MLLTGFGTVIPALCIGLLLPVEGRAADREKGSVEPIVTQVVRPLMEHEGIPGMAVGVVLDGKSYVFNYGTASRATGKPVNGDTLFEIGSVSKTFTAALASYAQAGGQLSLADPVSKYLPALRGSHLEEVSLLNLGTHTSGGAGIAGARRDHERRSTHAVFPELEARLRSWDLPDLRQS